jgi:hypothetical protein
MNGRSQRVERALADLCPQFSLLSALSAFRERSASGTSRSRCSESRNVSRNNVQDNSVTMAKRLQQIVGTDAKMVARVGTWLRRRQSEKLPHEDTLKKFVKLFRLKRRAAASLTPQEEQRLAKHEQGRWKRHLVFLKGLAVRHNMHTAGKPTRESALRRKSLTKEEHRQLKLIRDKWLRRAAIVKKK